MKFIKLGSGDYLNADNVTRFRVSQDDCLDPAEEMCFVELDSEPIAAFDTRAEAEKYLEELITRLETE